jgi:hypothetical protein
VATRQRRGHQRGREAGRGRGAMVSGRLSRRRIYATLGATVKLLGLVAKRHLPACAHLRSADPSSRVRPSAPAQPSPQLERTIALQDTGEIPVSRHGVLQSVATDRHSSIMWLVPVEGISARVVPSGELEGEPPRG